jgi:hypothetical protein
MEDIYLNAGCSNTSITKYSLTLGTGLVVQLLLCIFKISNKLPYNYAARDLTSYWLLAVPIGKRLQIVIGFGHKNPITI